MKKNVSFITNPFPVLTTMMLELIKEKGSPLNSSYLIATYPSSGNCPFAGRNFVGLSKEKVHAFMKSFCSFVNSNCSCISTYIWLVCILQAYSIDPLFPPWWIDLENQNYSFQFRTQLQSFPLLTLNGIVHLFSA